MDELKPNSKQALTRLRQDAENILAPLGYEIISLEQQTGGGRKLVLYIDFLNNQDQTRRIGLNDCISVNKAIDDLFETTSLLEGNYTLEVSSPGVERPLCKETDFEKFQGRKARVQTYRPLEKEEIENSAYWERNKKQKNFVGLLEGVCRQDDQDRTIKVKLSVDEQTVYVPFELISKAHLEYIPERAQTARSIIKE